MPFQLCHLALSALALGVLMLLPGYVCAGQTRHRNNSVCVLSNCSEGNEPQNPSFLFLVRLLGLECVSRLVSSVPSGSGSALPNPDPERVYQVASKQQMDGG